MFKRFGKVGDKFIDLNCIQCYWYDGANDYTGVDTGHADYIKIRGDHLEELRLHFQPKVTYGPTGLEGGSRIQDRPEDAVRYFSHDEYTDEVDRKKR